MNQTVTAQITDIDTIVGELSYSLEHVAPEEELLDFIAERLVTLRRLFRSDRLLFTSSQIKFLKSLAAVSVCLRSFVEVREELIDVGSVDEFDGLLKRLVDIEDGLAGFAVCRRVRREMRDLNERLPTIREQGEANREFRVSTRICDIEQNPIRCGNNHLMAIRRGQYGHFWGCTKYPSCQEVVRLKPEQKELLLSRKSTC